MQQRQLDVYGEVVDALCLAARSGIPADRHAWSLQRALLDFLEKHWAEPDEGLWEVRGPRRHFVHSKVMAWVAFDRAVQRPPTTGLPAPVDRWRQLRDRIHGGDARRVTTPSAARSPSTTGRTTLDASVLLMAELGFLPPRRPPAGLAPWTRSPAS